MIDLAQIDAKVAQAEADGGRTVAVSTAWLRQVADELRDGRAAAARVGHVFGKRGKPV